MRVTELKTEEYGSFYKTYLDALGDAELFNILTNQLLNFPQFLDSIPDDKLNYAYAEGKWTVSEVLVHIMDTERVMQYRALRFMRGDLTPLPGFDQDIYVPNSNSALRTKEDIIEEYKIIRQSTIALFTNMDKKALGNVGTASNNPMSVAALGFIICGHQKHHRNIIRDRYLNGKT
ncbi:DinB family protein [Maribacter luteus]|uniref:DinB family protein n=1 Tax=Maribacter luteus TaxID=2594478 RepID=A0A6I2MJI4_9FLAO|nr:DinB family protein [Maribacter luteus]MRX63933.1 DinB family protein [Maribacter luteus]